MKFLDKQDKKILMLKRLAIAANNSYSYNDMIRCVLLGATAPLPYEGTQTDIEGNPKINALISQKDFDSLSAELEKNQGEKLSNLIAKLNLFDEYDIFMISQGELNGNLERTFVSLLEYALLEREIY